jgi:heme/copper-type cytochrome/quinol oxidase subunit 2
MTLLQVDPAAAGDEQGSVFLFGPFVLLFLLFIVVLGITFVCIIRRRSGDRKNDRDD